MLDGHTVTRDMLIEAFSDGKTPDGSDFKSLISCMIMRSANDTAFDDKTMGMLTANDHQTQLGMQNNKFVTPLRLRNWHDKQLKPVFEDLRAKDSAQDVVIKDLDTSLQRYINERVNDALSKLSQAQSSLEQKITQSQNTVQGNLNATTQSLYTRMLPVGSVIMWGLVDKDFPDTFQLCDGGSFVYNGRTYKKPDLRGRFALGSGTPVNILNQPIATGTNHYFGQDGGAERVALSVSEMPSHTHSHNANGSNGKKGSRGIVESYGQHTTGSVNDEWTYWEYGLTKSFPLVIDNSGNNDTHNNMPPYRTLHYIIKVKD